MKGRFFVLALLALLDLLAACSNWNERASEFATYADFQAGKYARGGHMPSNLVPASARGIRVVYDIDTTEIDVGFDFAPADAERVIAPFRTPDQVRLHELERHGLLPASKVQNPMFIRCTVHSVEFLQITGTTHAHYWSSLDPTIRQTACPRVDNAPTISI
jgi:hypothetical protein